MAHTSIVFNSPICPVIGSAFPGIASTSNYIMRLIDRLQHDSLRSITVKQSAQTEFNEWAQQRMQGMAWAGDCKSWCKSTFSVTIFASIAGFRLTLLLCDQTKIPRARFLFLGPAPLFITSRLPSLFGGKILISFGTVRTSMTRWGMGLRRRALRLKVFPGSAVLRKYQM